MAEWFSAETPFGASWETTDWSDYMKKKLICIALLILTLATIMVAEYRFIMVNLCPYRGENGTVYIEIFGQVDTYYADFASELFKE